MAGGRAALIVDVHRGVDVATTAAVASGVRATDALFGPAFVASGAFLKVHGGDIDVLRNLQGLDGLQMIALGLETIALARDTVAGEALTRASVEIVVRIIRPSTGFATATLTVLGVGVAFDERVAVSRGTEDAVKKLIAELGTS